MSWGLSQEFANAENLWRGPRSRVPFFFPLVSFEAGGTRRGGDLHFGGAKTDLWHPLRQLLQGPLRVGSSTQRSLMWEFTARQHSGGTSGSPRAAQQRGASGGIILWETVITEVLC